MSHCHQICVRFQILAYVNDKIRVPFLMCLRHLKRNIHAFHMQFHDHKMHTFYTIIVYYNYTNLALPNLCAYLYLPFYMHAPLCIQITSQNSFPCIWDALSKCRSGRAQYAAPQKGNVRLGRNIAFDFYKYDTN
jgi:hypothetical protein